MHQKYPKAQIDYEDDQWQKTASRQKAMQKTGFVALIIVIITIGLFFFR